MRALATRLAGGAGMAGHEESPAVHLHSAHQEPLQRTFYGGYPEAQIAQLDSEC
ncbi:MAG: hypothetical protein ACYC91_12785 [Solirubrobacteraceae bacterium]